VTDLWKGVISIWLRATHEAYGCME
jgi:hypothetical protein